MKLTLSTRIKKNPRLITKKISRQVIILDPIAGEIRTLNEVAGFVWGAIKRGITIKEIVQKVCETFDVPKTQAQKDTLRFLKKYFEEGLIQSD